MRTSAVAASAFAALATAGASVLPAGAAAPAAPLLGIVLDGGQGRLARLDPDSLRPLRTSSFLTNGYAVAPALSPDRTRVALGSTSFVGVRIVDVQSMRKTQEIRLRASGAHVAATAWPSDGRLVLACVSAEPAVLFVTVDPEHRKILRLRRVAGTAVRAVRTRDGLAVLLAPRSGIGPARLAVASPTTLRVWRLPVSAGRRWSVGGGTGAQRIPGLAVDPARGRGYVADPGDRVIEVALATGDVGVHAPALRTPAKSLRGPQRSAVWLGGGLVAVTGSDDDAGRQPAGLRLVDVRNWTVRTVDADASRMLVARSVLVAFGEAATAPIRVYGLDGALRVELEAVAAPGWVQVWENRLYVGRRVLELPSGRVLAESVAAPRVVVLSTDGSTLPL
jgi:hypothetical protein